MGGRRTHPHAGRRTGAGRLVAWEEGQGSSVGEGRGHWGLAGRGGGPGGWLPPGPRGEAGAPEEAGVAGTAAAPLGSNRPAETLKRWGEEPESPLRAWFGEWPPGEGNRPRACTP